jgi:hypothetical protein
MNFIFYNKETEDKLEEESFLIPINANEFFEPSVERHMLVLITNK